MIYLFEQLRFHRRRLEMTQEDVANALGVAPQTVSKWERTENYPDITLLPALANLFQITVDELLGMEQFREAHRIGTVYTQAREYLYRQDWPGAIAIYEQALRTWPNDAGILTDLAMALALSGQEAQLVRAQELCERVLSMADMHHIKTQHTARAALCYIHAKTGDTQKALQCARQLPHQRESREIVEKQIVEGSNWNALIFELSTGKTLSSQNS